MIVRATDNALSRTTLLTVLLGTSLGPDMPALVDGPGLDRLLAWSRRQPDGALDLSDAPLKPTHRDALPLRQNRLDAALSGWRRDGWQIIGRDDLDYPKRLRRRLGAGSPALFIQGDPALAGCGGIALVSGSEDGHASERDAVLAALSRSTLVRIQQPAGVDSISIERLAEPTASAVLRLAPPEQAGPADVALDRCRHALADAVVVSRLRRSDAAWDGIAALVAEHRQPVWVTETEGDIALLIRAGARPIPPGLFADGAAVLLRPMPSTQARRTMQGAPRPGGGVDPIDAFRSAMGPALVRGFAETQDGFGAPFQTARDDASAGSPVRNTHLRLVEGASRPARPNVAMAGPAGPTLFDLFAEKLVSLLSHGPLGAGLIAETLDLTRPQVDAWLLQVEAAGTVRFDSQTHLYARQDR